MHMERLDFIFVGEGWINATAIDELAGVGLNLHAFFFEEKVDKSFAGIRSRRLGAKGDVLAVTEHRIVANVIETRSLFVVSQNETHEGDAEGRLAGADAV